MKVLRGPAHRKEHSHPKLFLFHPRSKQDFHCTNEGTSDWTHTAWTHSMKTVQAFSGNQLPKCFAVRANLSSAEDDGSNGAAAYCTLVHWHAACPPSLLEARVRGPGRQICTPNPIYQVSVVAKPKIRSYDITLSSTHAHPLLSCRQLGRQKLHIAHETSLGSPASDATELIPHYAPHNPHCAVYCATTSWLHEWRTSKNFMKDGIKRCQKNPWNSYTAAPHNTCPPWTYRGSFLCNTMLCQGLGYTGAL